MTDNLETCSLLWLDSAVNTSKENIKAQDKLRLIINHLKTFEDAGKCEKYIGKCHKSDRIVLIVSGGMGREILPRIYKLQQVSSVYVYCMDKKANSEWSNEYSKVKLVTTHLDKLIRQIEIDQGKTTGKIEEQASINFLEVENETGRTSIGLNGQYLNSQLLMDGLLRIDPSSADKEELISVCNKNFKGNRRELDNVHDFKKTYTPSQAVLWYTKETFLYRMLNKALRVQNFRLLYLFRFFIQDLHEEIAKLQCKAPIKTYRAQLISKDELHGIQRSIGKLISMNSFVSTSVDPKNIDKFMNPTNDLNQVIFEIDADPRLPGVKPFADISSASAHPSEKEVLIMLGSIFRVLDISRPDGGTWVIRMILCSDNDNRLQAIYHHLKNENFGKSNEQTRVAYGYLLHKMGKSDDADKYFRDLLEGLPPGHKEIAGCYFALGNLALEKSNHKISLDWHQRSLDIKMKMAKPDDLEIAQSYNCIGNVYAQKNDYEQALISYNKAFEIWKQKLGNEHQDVALCLNNIGNVFVEQKRYSEALQHHQKALTIRKSCLPPNHPDVATSLYNMGLIYLDTGRVEEALKHFEQSLVIKRMSLPSDHPSIAGTLENIGSAYEHKGDFRQALSYYKKADEGYRQTYNSEHKKIVGVEKRIQRVKAQLKKSGSS